MGAARRREIDLVLVYGWIAAKKVHRSVSFTGPESAKRKALAS